MSVPVTVAIPTFKRPSELAGLLQALVPEIGLVPPEFEVEILVVDNDAAASARDSAMAATHPRLRYVVEPEPGITAVRNRALEECAGRRLVAFIDDDEMPVTDWLSSLVRQWEQSGRPAGVSGRIVPEFTGEPDPWLVAGRFFERRNLPSGTELEIAATGNLLLDVTQVRALGVSFDPRFGLTGGEDSLFSQQLVSAGGRLVWCAESVALDRVPPERMTRRWVLQRARSHGNSSGRVALELATSAPSRGLVRARLLAGGLARAVIGGVRAGGGYLTGSQRLQARGRRLTMRGLGFVTAAVGQQFHEYARPAPDPAVQLGDGRGSSA